jgi:hypothetical protein
MEDRDFNSGQLKRGFLFAENFQRLSKWRVGRGVRLKTLV